MGADLTIVKGKAYFRDSYNETNILWRFGLSYWGLEKQIKIGEVGRIMKFGQVKTLRDEIEKRKPEFEKFLKEVDEAWLAEHHCEAGVAEWVKFWKEKAEKFTAFLDMAISAKSGIEWNV